MFSAQTWVKSQVQELGKEVYTCMWIKRIPDCQGPCCGCQRFGVRHCCKVKKLKWGIPEREIRSLCAMGWGSGQIKECRHVIAAVVGVILRLRSTFWPGSYIWSLSWRNFVLVTALDILRPFFCPDIRYLSGGRGGLARGAILENDHISRTYTFSKMGMHKQNML